MTDRLARKTVSWSNGPVISLNYGYDANGNVNKLWYEQFRRRDEHLSIRCAQPADERVRQRRLAQGYAFDAVANLQTISYGKRRDEPEPA